LIANKAAANRILKEQYEESKTPDTSDALSAFCLYRLESGVSMLATVDIAGGCRKKSGTDDLMTLDLRNHCWTTVRILGSTHATGQIDYSPNAILYEIGSKLFMLEDDECLESWIYRLKSG
jgi:hypothetical protein